jgi:antitoxin (DNA-binding transcriptional repressor) of toxin-antitoxin stability system
MKFVSVRDFRSKSGKVWKELAHEKDLLLTSNGKPIALISSVTGENVEESLALLRRARATAGVEKMQSRSMATSASKLTLKEINAEIEAVRKGRKG